MQVYEKFLWILINDERNSLDSTTRPQKLEVNGKTNDLIWKSR